VITSALAGSHGAVVFGVDGHGAVVLALGVCLDADAARRGVSKYRLAYLDLLLLGANGLTCASVLNVAIDDAVLAVGAALSDGRYLVAAFVEDAVVIEPTLHHAERPLCSGKVSQRSRIKSSSRK
jgi:DNA-binding LytR/AlgR family response regulator